MPMMSDRSGELDELSHSEIPANAEDAAAAQLVGRQLPKLNVKGSGPFTRFWQDLLRRMVGVSILLHLHEGGMGRWETQQFSLFC